METVTEGKWRYSDLSLRLKLYLILAFVSLILLFYSIWQIKPVIVEPTDLFGLASKLTPAYWIGLALILLCSILAFLDREHRSDALFVFLLVVLGLFLFGISVFSQEYPRDVGAYYPSAEVKNLIEFQHVDIGASLPSYNSWPALQFITASILEITGIDHLEWLRYFPLFWVFCFILIIYSIGKRLKLPPNSQFLLAFFVLTSYWMMWSSFSPQSIAMLLYLLIFMLLIAPQHSVNESVLVILAFSALLITHSIASLAILLSLITLSLYRRQTKFIGLFLVLFIAWYVFQAVAMFEQGVTDWWSAPFRQIFQMLQQVKGTGGVAPPQRMILRYSQLSYLALYFMGVIAAITLLWRRKVNKENDKLIMSCIFWIGGILGLGIVVPSTAAPITDMLSRFYLYGLVPAVCIVLLGLRYRKLLVILMVLLVALHLPAHYGAEVAWGQVLPTEFKGNEFFALRVKPQEPYFYNDGDVQKLIFFHDPELSTIHHFSRQWDFPDSNKVEPTVLSKARYLVIGKQGSDRAIWGSGHDPMTEWLKTEAGEELDLIYNNGKYQIYENRKFQ